MNRADAIKQLAKMAELLETDKNIRVVRISDTTIQVFRLFGTTWDSAECHYVDREGKLVRDADGKLVEDYMIKVR